MQRGQDWNKIPCKTSPENLSGRGSRLDHFIARTLSVTVKTLLQIRTGHDLREAYPRGRNPHPLAALTESEMSAIHAAADDEQEEVNMQEFGSGAFIGSIPQNLKMYEKNLTVALVLGRLMLQTLTSSSVLCSYVPKTLQAFLAGAPVGQKHHDRNALAAMSRVFVSVVEEDLRARFAGSPPALTHLELPRIWGAEIDGVTISNGTSLLPIMVHFTSESGTLELLGCKSKNLHTKLGEALLMNIQSSPVVLRFA